jgi:hypothetical protein
MSRKEMFVRCMMIATFWAFLLLTPIKCWMKAWNIET